MNIAQAVSTHWERAFLSGLNATLDLQRVVHAKCKASTATTTLIRRRHHHHYDNNTDTSPPPQQQQQAFHVALVDALKQSGLPDATLGGMSAAQVTPVAVSGKSDRAMPLWPSKLKRLPTRAGRRDAGQAARDRRPGERSFGDFEMAIRRFLAFIRRFYVFIRRFLAGEGEGAEATARAFPRDGADHQRGATTTATTTAPTTTTTATTIAPTTTTTTLATTTGDDAWVREGHCREWHRLAPPTRRDHRGPRAGSAIH